MSKIAPVPVDLILTLGRKPEPLLPGTSCSALSFAMTQGCLGSVSPLIPNPSTLQAPFPLNPGPVTYSPRGLGISDFTFVRFLFSTCNGGIGNYLMGVGGHRLYFAKTAAPMHLPPRMLFLRDGFDVPPLGGGVCVSFS